MKKNFLISTGGSGGHVIPAIIFYQHLSNEANIIISTDSRGLNYLDENFHELEIIDTPKLSNIFLLPFSLVKIFILTIKSFFLLKRKKIEKIISTGGYMSIPIILAAKLLKLDIYLIEPNQVLGRANRFFLSSCKKIFCYSKEIKKFPFKFKNKIIMINPLVKKEIYEANLHTEIETKFNLLVVGGSQGAKIFDNNLKEIIKNISKKFPIRIFHQTNKKNISELTNYYLENNVDCNIFSFDKNFFKTIKRANLCITRAGASTLAELSVLNIPFIAIPLPISKDNHQFENANFYKNKDCCWIIDQNYFEKKIDDLLMNILNNKTEYLKKKENLKKLNFQNTWNSVNQKILKIINEN